MTGAGQVNSSEPGKAPTCSCSRRLAGEADGEALASRLRDFVGFWPTGDLRPRGVGDRAADGLPAAAAGVPPPGIAAGVFATGDRAAAGAALAVVGCRWWVPLLRRVAARSMAVLLPGDAAAAAAHPKWGSCAWLPVA